MYPNSQTLGRGVFFMKYDWKFKYQCVLDYKAGKEIPNDMFGSAKRKLDSVEIWTRIFDIHGVEGLKHKSFYKEWTKEERYEIVAKILAGKPIKPTAIETGINPGQLYSWVKRYKEYGYEGLELSHRGRPPKGGSNMTKNTKQKPTKLNQSEREELILLRRKLEYAEAENAYLKKLAALVAEKKAESSAKAKKQSSSKDS